MLDLAIAGIPASVLVVGLVEAIKRLFKVQGDGAIAVALVVGVVLAAGAHMASISPAFGEWWQAVIAGLVVGLAACGLYDAGQAIKARATEPPAQ